MQCFCDLLKKKIGVLTELCLHVLGSSAARKFEQKVAKFFKKTYIKLILKSQKTYNKGLPKVKNVYIKALKIMPKTSLNRFFDNFPKVAQKEPNCQVAKAKYWLPNGSKSSPNGNKLPNLAALLGRYQSQIDRVPYFHQ